MINIQPMLDEDRESRGHSGMKRPELVKLIYTHGNEAVQAIREHW